VPEKKNKDTESLTIFAPVFLAPSAVAFLVLVTVWLRARRATAFSMLIIPVPVIVALALLVPSAVAHIALAHTITREERQVT
jgi:hypothetical protein